MHLSLSQIGNIKGYSIIIRPGFNDETIVGSAESMNPIPKYQIAYQHDSLARLQLSCYVLHGARIVNDFLVLVLLLL